MKEKGSNLKLQIMELVLEFLRNRTGGMSSEEGVTQALIFRECGLDWGDQLNATSSQQQFWIVALLRVLQKEGKIIRNSKKLWRIADKYCGL